MVRLLKQGLSHVIIISSITWRIMRMAMQAASKGIPIMPLHTMARSLFWQWVQHISKGLREVIPKYKNGSYWLEAILLTHDPHCRTPKLYLCSSSHKGGWEVKNLIYDTRCLWNPWQLIHPKIFFGMFTYIQYIYCRSHFPSNTWVVRVNRLAPPVHFFSACYKDRKPGLL